LGSELRHEEPADSRLIVRAPRNSDITAIARNLRAEDLAEVTAASGQDPVDAIGLGFAYSKPCFVVEFETRPAAIFGVVPTPGLECFGSVWLLGTNDIPLFSQRFLRDSRRWLEQITVGYDMVGNVVDERNEKHIRWLRWLGFKFVKRHAEYGHLGLPFLEFVKAVEAPPSV